MTIASGNLTIERVYDGLSNPPTYVFSLLNSVASGPPAPPPAPTQFAQGAIGAFAIATRPVAASGPLVAGTGAIDSRAVGNSWFRHNASVFLPRVASDGTPYNAHAAHCEIVVVTNATFGGDFTIYAVPTNSTGDASAMGVWVDGVFQQTVSFDVTTNLNKLQAVVVHTGVTGVHTIRIQEGERDPGVFTTRLLIDGSIITPPAVLRQYTTLGDSVSMGAFAIPRTLGWAERMRAGTRFDGFAMLGRSGYSLSTATPFSDRVAEIMPSLIGTTENVLALCLGINDWVTSAGSTSSATFGTNLGTLIDLIKAAVDAASTPGFKLMLHSLTRINGGLPGSANGQGSTPADFNAAIAAVAAARSSYATYLDVFGACTDADLYDSFIHPNAVGHGKIYAVVAAGT